MDMVGLDIAEKVGQELADTKPPDNELSRLVKQGKLGKKTGEGFYVWEKGKAKRGDVTYEAAELERLGQKLIAPMLDECERALADQIVASADHVDAGVIFGTGFAPFRGGPLHYRRTQQESGRTAQEAA
jgi:3-hydroxyacyl-CoA dehydrogenase/enoyl-CoA hydratase/3-hydroxybutyryl-CoA epimerase